MAKRTNNLRFKEWFVAERTRSLAVVFLTRRDDLCPENAEEGTGLGFLVRIVHNHRPTGKSFGIVLQGAMSPVTEEQANKLVKPAMAAFHRLGPSPYPVCLFFFTMRDNQGYYTWLQEPVVTDRGSPKLVRRTDPDCQKLDNDALDHIIVAVNAWYDVLLAEPTS
jgi:hypothetical protein